MHDRRTNIIIYCCVLMKLRPPFSIPNTHLPKIVTVRLRIYIFFTLELLSFPYNTTNEANEYRQVRQYSQETIDRWLERERERTR